jgi:uncharacterized protein YabN with tetrapyrrole methylase and pyrophosphatase domain
VIADASAEGFAWGTATPARSKLAEELEELRAAVLDGCAAATQDELGDVLIAVVGLAYWLRIDPADALRASTEKFASRLAVARTLAGPERFADASLDDLTVLWRMAKAQIARADQGHR